MPDPDPRISRQRLKSAGHWTAVLWIFGGALYFYVRLTWLLVQENQAAVHGFAERLRQVLTLG